MKKTFPLHIEGKHPDRVLDALKHELRKYLKRERSRAMPIGSDYWAFDCKIGASAETAQPVHVAELSGAVDAQVQGGAKRIYVEIVARAARRHYEQHPSTAEDSSQA